MLLLPFILHAGLGLSLRSSRLRRSSHTPWSKKRLTQTISASVILVFIETFDGDSLSDSLSRGVTYFSRAAAPIAASQVPASGSVTRTDVVIYDTWSTDVTIYTDHCVKHERSAPSKRPRFSALLNCETNYGPWEMTIEEGQQVVDIPFLFDANDVRQALFIGPEDFDYTFARGTSEEPSPASTSSSDRGSTPATDEPGSQATRRSSRERKLSRRSAKKEPTDRTDNSRNGRKVQKAPKPCRDKLLRTAHKLRSRFAQLPRHTRERAIFLFGFIFYPGPHFVRNQFIHRHVRVFVVYAIISYLGVHTVLVAVERRTPPHQHAPRLCGIWCRMFSPS
ncbi:hypothetical protein BS17DRAFT_43516 [Gyrodon lividus]|nr:hypothetical protein BS17DRAFT_43516 [Gyrodon lividus]